MKNNFIKTIFISGLVACGLFATSCDLDPEYHSDVVPETFFTSKEAVYQRFMRPFTHWKWYHASNRARYDLQELSTDEICISTKGGDWYNGGLHQNMHHHVFETTPGTYYDGFYGASMGIALAWDALRDLKERVPFDKLGFSDEERESLYSQMNILVANLYKDGLDLYGGMPLYTMDDMELLPRSSDVETFEFIEKLILDNIDKLPKKTKLGETETTLIHQGWAAFNLAQLYFNAEAYTKGQKVMYKECAKLCEDIIAGKYGAYDLGKSFQEIFGYGNENCPEVIYGIPSDATFSATEGGFFKPWFHYNTDKYLGGTAYDAWNGLGIQPSQKPDGTHYTANDFKLGRVMDKFEDTDLRKQPFTYEGKGHYTGMFLMGYQKSKSSRAGTGGLKDWVSMGARNNKGHVVYLIDRIAQFTSKAGVIYWTEDGLPMDKNGQVVGNDVLAKLPSDISTGEEGSCYRLIKNCPPVDKLEYDDMRMRFPAMKVQARLTEVYYMLAECEMRAGNKEKAAQLINKVRARYFVDGNDPNPVTSANLDKYRMLDEWMIEFLGEARRRTDLIRWNAFVTEAWWDHTPTNNKDLERFPIPEKSIAGNNKLQQNPGY